jgi:hypothetical protein
MFEKIAVQQQRAGDAENPLDIGFLVEAITGGGRTSKRCCLSISATAALRELSCADIR